MNGTLDVWERVILQLIAERGEMTTSQLRQDIEVNFDSDQAADRDTTALLNGLKSKGYVAHGPDGWSLLSPGRDSL